MALKKSPSSKRAVVPRASDRTKAIHADHVVSISELKKNPGAVVANQAKPVAVLNHNKPVFHVVPVKFMEAVFEGLDDRALYAKVMSRLGDLDKAVAVDIKDL